MRFIQLFIVLLAVAVSPAQAETRTSKQEAIGLGSGAAIGAAAAGPVGAIIGAGIGAIVGDRAHRNRKERDQLTNELEQARGNIGQLESDLEQVYADLAAIAHEDDAELKNLLSQGLEFQVLFRTDEDAVASESAGRIGELAKFLSEVQGIALEVDGFADQRGSDTHNRNLSMRRAENVKTLFVDGGVSDERIYIFGHGSKRSQATEGDLDAYALERRVTIRLIPDDMHVARSEH